MRNRHSRNLERVHAIVPLKVVDRSKTRLSALSSRERARLTIAMLQNVLAALSKSRRINDVTVVSADRMASKIAKRFGAEFLWEGKRQGLNRALRLAIKRLEEGADGTAMIIHADLPLLTSKDVDKFLERSQPCQIAIVPCKNGTGTNALLLRPSSAIPIAFGKGSFRRHLALAKKTKCQWKVIRIRNIQFDIDDPQDLRKFMRIETQSEGFRFLTS